MGGCLTDTAPVRKMQPTKYQQTNSIKKPIPNISIEKSGEVRSVRVILRPILPKQLIHPTSNPTLKNEIKAIANQFIQIKIPKDFNLWTQFIWIKQPLYNIPNTIVNCTSQFIKNRSFQQKLKWFRLNLQTKRVSWSDHKSQYLMVDRENILMSSNNQFQKINFYKEVKIEFNDEKQASDAGGLLRQWMNLCIKQIFNPDLGLFQLCDSYGTFYKFHYNQNVSELFEVASKILGVVIGKAIFERIPLKCLLNYTILRQLCSQPIQMNDVYSYDRDFYNGWNFMINNNMTTMLQQNFCVYELDEHGTQITIPLKQNGFQIMVNSTNKQQYITLMTQHYCTKSISKLLDNLKYGLYKIIPRQYIEVFHPHELDIILNGRQTIDANDLRLNTIYTGYNINDINIIWFWEYVGQLDQQRLSRMLHFVTGNGRVPILGFKYLESNRGQYQKFHIKQVKYDEIDPYPKSHTCFNRLELPRYPSKQIFDKYIEYITVEMMHFGLE